jgi:hypothetical protein
MSSATSTVTQLYEQIPLEAMQQVADSYMTWYVDRATRQFDETIAKLRAELEQNDKQEARFKPSAAELDAMRRLQANKVADVDLLDRLVEKGEEWLVLTMHRLDYFERAGLAPTDYPGWCEHALIGAYDWIDAPRLHASKRMFSLQGGGTGPMRAIRPSDLAPASAPKKEPAPQPRAEAVVPPRPVPPPQRAEPPAPRPAPAPAPRAQEPAEQGTQPVPSTSRPLASAQEQVGKLETAPLPPPASRAEAAPRQPAPAAPRQSTPVAPAPQRPPAVSGGIPDTPTRPTPTAFPTQKTMPPPQPAPGGAAGNAGVPPAVQRRPEPPPPPRMQQQPPAAPPQPAPQPYAAGTTKSRPTNGGPSWGGQEPPRSDPRYSLDDVEVEDLDEEGEDQGLIRKIFRVFTG